VSRISSRQDSRPQANPEERAPDQNQNGDGGRAKPHFLKRAVVKEELVALTGNFITAIILNQLIYWQGKTKDIDGYIQEEKDRCAVSKRKAVLEPTRGWFYKGSDELSAETMTNLALSSMREHIKKLIAAGWVLERGNPYHKWDRTKQYRVDVWKLRDDLAAIRDRDGHLAGYRLDGVRFAELATSVSEDADSDTENAGSDAEDRRFAEKNGGSAGEGRIRPNRRALPENTAETNPSASSGAKGSSQNDGAHAVLIKLKGEEGMRATEAEKLFKEFGAYRVGKAIGICDWKEFKKQLRGERRPFIIAAIKEDYQIPVKMRVEANRRFMEFEAWKEEKKLTKSDAEIVAEINEFLEPYKGDLEELKASYLKTLANKKILYELYATKDPRNHDGLRAAIFHMLQDSAKKP
jgi:hypothetical protein